MSILVYLGYTWNQIGPEAWRIKLMSWITNRGNGGFMMKTVYGEIAPNTYILLSQYT